MAIWDIPGTTQQQQAPAQNQSPWGNTSGDLFYNGGNYGQSQDWFNTPVGQNIREDHQNLAYGAWANRMGIANNDNNFNKWFYTQYPKFQQAYGQATMDNPMMTIDQFIGTLPNQQQLMNQFNALDPRSRGANYNAYAPQVRWIPR